MAREIEYKFLVRDDRWQDQVIEKAHLRQGYLAENERVEVRVRVIAEGGAKLTIKTAGGGIERTEFEYDIPTGNAKDLLGRCGVA